MNHEFEILTLMQRAAVQEVIEAARRQPGRHTRAMTAETGSITGQAYAFQLAEQGIAWGFDVAPWYSSIARGVAPYL